LACGPSTGRRARGRHSAGLGMTGGDHLSVSAGAGERCGRLAAVMGHPGRSVNRNRSVRFFGYSVNSVTSEPRTDWFLKELGTEAFRFRVIRFGFGSNRKEPKISKHRKHHIQMQILTAFHLFFMHPTETIQGAISIKAVRHIYFG
jgi:hypothetical protein